MGERVTAGAASSKGAACQLVRLQEHFPKTEDLSVSSQAGRALRGAPVFRWRINHAECGFHSHGWCAFTREDDVTRHLRSASCRRIYHGTARGRPHSGSAMNGHGPDRQEFENPDWPTCRRSMADPIPAVPRMVMGQTARSRSPDWPTIGAARRYAFITGNGPPGFHKALCAMPF